jgi:hypothetical protein
VPDFDINTPHIARIYDYWLGGRDHFPADREAAERAIAATPTIMPGVRANRRFLGRAVTYLAAETGIRQFLDIGTGIPAVNNTHEVAQAVAPDARVVYVDNDPIVMKHAQARLRPRTGTITYIEADARDTEKILSAAAGTLDFSRPVAVMLIAVLHCIPNEDDPFGAVRRLMAAVPPASHLALTHPGVDQMPAEMTAAQQTLRQATGQRVTFRTRHQVTRFFAGLELLDPGVVPVQDWHPTPAERKVATSGMWGGVARKR